MPGLQQQVFTSDIYQKWRKRKWKLLPATAGIYGWYIPQPAVTSVTVSPATAGIYGWYIPKKKELNLRPGPATAGIYG